MITFRQLEIFAAVAETSQVTRASKVLGLTQSAVSMALSELEHQLGGPLFDRHGRSLLLNDRGRYLLPQAKDMLHRAEAVENVLTGRQDRVAGLLQIAASSTLGNYVLPYIIGAFMRRWPEARVNTLVGNTLQAEKLVADGRADLGFVEGDINVDALIPSPWFTDELCVIVNPRHPLAGQTSFRIPEDLKKCTWVMREDGSGTAEIFSKRLGRHVRALEVITKTGHTEAIKRAVEAGGSAACLSRLAVAREVDEGWLRALDLEGVDRSRQFWIVQHRDKIVTRLMAEFLEFCERVARDHLEGASAAPPWRLGALLDGRPDAPETDSRLDG